MDTGAARKVSGREAVCAHVASAGGAVAAVPVELADGGGSYRYLGAHGILSHAECTGPLGSDYASGGQTPCNQPDKISLCRPVAYAGLFVTTVAFINAPLAGRWSGGSRRARRRCWCSWTAPRCTGRPSRSPSGRRRCPRPPAWLSDSTAPALRRRQRPEVGAAECMLCPPCARSRTGRACTSAQSGSHFQIIHKFLQPAPSSGVGCSLLSCRFHTLQHRLFLSQTASLVMSEHR